MEKEYFYIVCKTSMERPSLKIVVFDLSMDFNKTMKTLMNPPNNLITVSGGRCKLNVDSRQVTCYREPGGLLRPDADDSTIMANFLLGE